MIKLRDLILENWWTDKSVDGQTQYISSHPKTPKKTNKDNPSGKEERDDSINWKTGKDGWEILDDKRAKVTKVRDYTEQEYQEETDEFFGNSDSIAPGLAKSSSELVSKMKNAPVKYFSSEQLQNMNNTDVGELLDASDDGGTNAMYNLGKKKASEYGKDWSRLEKGIKDLDNKESLGVPPPIAIQDKNNDLHLMAGNTRMMSFTAAGKKLPLKVLKYNDTFDYDSWDVRNIKQEGLIKLKELIVERVDYIDTATRLVKKYKLKSKVKFNSGTNHGDYDWDTDIIYIDKSFSSLKEFYITVLHEIHHAVQRKKMGPAKYEKRYTQAGNMAVNKGRDFYKDNKYETRAENWAQSEYKTLIRRGELK